MTMFKREHRAKVPQDRQKIKTNTTKRK